MGGYAPPMPPAMPPSGGQQTPPAAPPAGGNMAVMQLMKSLGVADGQGGDPMVIEKVVQACMGKLGPDAKRMALAVGGMAPGSMPEGGAPTTPDAGQAGGQPAPPNPNGPSGQGDASTQPGAPTDGKMPGAATIFGRQPVGTAGDQAQNGSPEPEEDDQQMPRAKTMFRGRR